MDRRVRGVMAYKLVRHVPNITPIGCHGSSCSWCHGLQARQTCPQYNTYGMSRIIVFDDIHTLQSHQQENGDVSRVTSTRDFACNQIFH